MKVTSAEFIKGIRGTDPIAENDIAQVAFVGRSNVGKSSLIAAITHNRHLVKVSNRPGKTTEINFFLINKKYYLVDLPGYGFARVNPKEKEKLQKLIVWYLTDPTIRPRKVVIVIDTKVGITAFDQQMIEILREQGHPFVIAANKIDKLSKNELKKKLEYITIEALGGEVHAVSAIKRHGIDELVRTLFI